MFFRALLIGPFVGEAFIRKTVNAAKDRHCLILMELQFPLALLQGARAQGKLVRKTANFAEGPMGTLLCTSQGLSWLCRSDFVPKESLLVRPIISTRIRGGT